MRRGEERDGDSRGRPQKERKSVTLTGVTTSTHTIQKHSNTNTGGGDGRRAGGGRREGRPVPGQPAGGPVMSAAGDRLRRAPAPVGGNSTTKTADYG